MGRASGKAGGIDGVKALDKTKWFRLFSEWEL